MVRHTVQILAEKSEFSSDKPIAIGLADPGTHITRAAAYYGEGLESDHCFFQVNGTTIADYTLGSDGESYTQRALSLG